MAGEKEEISQDSEIVQSLTPIDKPVTIGFFTTQRGFVQFVYKKDVTRYDIGTIERGENDAPLRLITTTYRQEAPWWLFFNSATYSSRKLIVPSNCNFYYLDDKDSEINGE